jgi:four helix bundle protein
MEKQIIKTYRDLKIWQKSIEMVTVIYKLTSHFPNRELFGITSQIRRSSISIPSNIAEGYGRYSRKEYIRFLGISLGSLYEMQTQLQISLNLGYLSSENFHSLSEGSKEIERMLSGLIRKLKIQ